MRGRSAEKTILTVISDDDGEFERERWRGCLWNRCLLSTMQGFERARRKRRVIGMSHKHLLASCFSQSSCSLVVSIVDLCSELLHQVLSVESFGFLGNSMCRFINVRLPSDSVILWSLQIRTSQAYRLWLHRLRCRVYSCDQCEESSRLDPQFRSCWWNEHDDWISHLWHRRIVLHRFLQSSSTTGQRSSWIAQCHVQHHHSIGYFPRQKFHWWRSTVVLHLYEYLYVLQSSCPLCLLWLDSSTTHWSTIDRAKKLRFRESTVNWWSHGRRGRKSTFILAIDKDLQSSSLCSVLCSIHQSVGLARLRLSEFSSRLVRQRRSSLVVFTDDHRHIQRRWSHRSNHRSPTSSLLQLEDHSDLVSSAHVLSSLDLLSSSLEQHHHPTSSHGHGNDQWPSHHGDIHGSSPSHSWSSQLWTSCLFDDDVALRGHRHWIDSRSYTFDDECSLTRSALATINVCVCQRSAFSSSISNCRLPSARPVSSQNKRSMEE